MAGFNCPHPDTGLPIFAFRVHQFISRGDTIYASVEPESNRYITLHGQQYVPDDRTRTLLPVVFCRDCGQEYYSVWRDRDDDTAACRYLPRNFSERTSEEDGEAGFLYVSSERPWPVDDAELETRLPDDWFDERGQVQKGRRANLPEAVRVGADGREAAGGLQCSYIAAPFRFCLSCGVSYGFRQRSDFHKLAELGTGGRSSATTILSLSTILNLRKMPLDATAQKLLSFTDNRQDASLQAGHFNDFVEVGLLRSALYRAVRDAGQGGVRHDELAQRVFQTLALPVEAYANDPTLRGRAREDINRVLRDVFGYRMYRDLQRGWRIMAPNLEQVGLLTIEYPYLREACEDEELWVGYHSVLASASLETRIKIAKVLLDLMRRELAINVYYLSANDQELLLQRSRQWLVPPWGFDDNDQVGNMVQAAILYPRTRRKKDYRGNVYVSARSAFGQYLRRSSTFGEYDGKVSLADAEAILQQLLDCLRIHSLLEVVDEPKNEGEVPGYQLRAAALLWCAGDGTEGYYDPIRRPTESTEGTRPNSFFVNYYRTTAADTLGVEAREHTAQVMYDEREKRENRFRDGTLSILFCSPTMELGIDIAMLNAVNLRNVPPTPANYAQRSGRAGRSGQPALVFTYCAGGSPHDQYYFKRPAQMVAGAVRPAQLDMANEDLIRAHIHAIWLAETGLSLQSSLKDILDVSGEEPTLALQEHVREDVNAEAPKNRAIQRAERILMTITEALEASDWYSDNWLKEIISHIPVAFEQACDRWRGLYSSALRQAQSQDKIIRDASRSSADKSQAERLRRDSEAQLRLLTELKNLVQSDFYSYRYFASEGFLPGYSFPRLPLSAYIPGRRFRGGKDEFLSRPRFLAISEFAPRAIVYHEGSHYVISRVILPVQDDEELNTGVAKLCPACGYLHPSVDGQGPDLCEMCNATLGAPLRKLFRLQNVVTRRRDRISCDEEERRRLGYEIKTVVRFAQRGGEPSYQIASLHDNGQVLATMYYGNAATLWRINLGEARRKQQDQLGFLLDVERGYWARREDEGEDEGNPMSPRTERVIPYVEDRRNCLLFELAQPPGQAVMASLQTALKHSIQACYELEDNELAAEPLPDRENRKSILFYEAAEGGAGVLRRLIDDPQAMSNVVKTALELCHFDTSTGEDQRRSGFVSENCEAACYDCLLSYSNQRDHQLLDRQLIRDILLKMTTAELRTSPAPVPRARHLDQLMRLAGSGLERRWLTYLEEGNYRLPTDAQQLMTVCRTRPDFIYRDKQVVVYIDGPPHDYPERAERDRQQTECMEDHGWTVIRFVHNDAWENIISENPSVFGDGS